MGLRRKQAISAEFGDSVLSVVVSRPSFERPLCAGPLDEGGIAYMRVLNRGDIPCCPVELRGDAEIDGGLLLCEGTMLRLLIERRFCNELSRMDIQ